MRKTILILTTVLMGSTLMGSTMAQAMGPSPLGPVSRDLLLAKLTTVQYSMNSLDNRQARLHMTSLVRMLEVDAYYTSSRFLAKAREVLDLIEEGDLATADVTLDELFKIAETMTTHSLGTA